MIGYFDSNANDKKGVLKIQVTNVPQFEELLEKAKKEADQLQATVRQLAIFDLTIEISSGVNENKKI